MNSTEGDSHTAKIRDLFLNRLLPAVGAPGSSRVFFPVGPDPKATSYYIDRSATQMTKADFLIATADGSGDPIVALGELWHRQGLDRLAALIPELRALAGELRQVEKPADDVSSFIYVMF